MEREPDTEYYEDKGLVPKDRKFRWKMLDQPHTKATE